MDRWRLIVNGVVFEGDAERHVEIDAMLHAISGQLSARGVHVTDVRLVRIKPDGGTVTRTRSVPVRSVRQKGGPTFSNWWNVAGELLYFCIRAGAQQLGSDRNDISMLLLGKRRREAVKRIQAAMRDRELHARIANRGLVHAIRALLKDDA